MNHKKIFYNGKIITMAEGSSYQNSPGAVLISDGLILKTGSLDDISRDLDSAAEWIDLHGKCLMPSFIDPHSHIVMNGQMSLAADLSECNSFDDIIHAFKQYIAIHQLTDKDIVIGFGYDHNFLNEQSHPDKYILDQASTSIPIMAMHISGHLCCVNSAWLNLAGIDKDIKDPSGGRIGRTEDGNEPNGYFEEAAQGLVQSVIQSRMQFSVNTIMENMQDIYLQNGITTVQDGASTNANILLLRSMGKSGKLKVDIVCYPLLASEGKKTLNANKDIDGKYTNHVKIGGYKIILDGSPQGKSAWLSQPYEGESKFCSYGSYDDDTVEKFVMQAIHEQRQILAHCNGDAASEQFLNAYEHGIQISQNKKDLRPVMVHCQTVRKDQLDRMAKLHMIASIFVGHVWYWGDVHLKNLGEKRGMHISPVKDALDSGVLVNFHQDTPVTKPNMLHSVWCAVNRLSRSGKVIGADQKICVYDALKAVTINAAYQYFEENEKGSIEEGKRADLVILSDSPLEISQDKIKDIQVLETIKDGQTVFTRSDS